MWEAALTLAVVNKGIGKTVSDFYVNSSLLESLVFKIC